MTILICITHKHFNLILYIINTINIIYIYIYIYIYSQLSVSQTTDKSNKGTYYFNLYNCYTG